MKSKAIIAILAAMLALAANAAGKAKPKPCEGCKGKGVVVIWEKCPECGGKAAWKCDLCKSSPRYGRIKIEKPCGKCRDLRETAPLGTHAQTYQRYLQHIRIRPGEPFETRTPPQTNATARTAQPKSPQIPR